MNPPVEHSRTQSNLFCFRGKCLNGQWRFIPTSADTLERGGDLDGAVYIYRLNDYGNRNYAWEGAITGDSVSGVNEEFGASLKFKPGTNTLAVGAPGHPSDPTLDWSDRSWPNAGAVYIY